MKPFTSFLFQVEYFLVAHLISSPSCDVKPFLSWQEEKFTLHLYTFDKIVPILTPIWKCKNIFCCCWERMNYSSNFLALNQNNDTSFFKYLSDKVSFLTLLDPGPVLHKIKPLGLYQSQMLTVILGSSWLHNYKTFFSSSF